MKDGVEPGTAVVVAAMLLSEQRSVTSLSLSFSLLASRTGGYHAACHDMQESVSRACRSVALRQRVSVQ